MAKVVLLAGCTAMQPNASAGPLAVAVMTSPPVEGFGGDDTPLPKWALALVFPPQSYPPPEQKSTKATALSEDKGSDNKDSRQEVDDKLDRLGTTASVQVAGRLLVLQLVTVPSRGSRLPLVALTVAKVRAPLGFV